jgi:putative transcriptional regulator
MPKGWLNRFVPALALLLVAGSLHAAPSGSDQVPAADPLVGQLLIATPDASDPRFAHAVILIVEHGDGGALGIVINRPVEEQPIATILERIGKKDPQAQGKVLVFAGGPVEPWIGFVLHSPEYHSDETTDIDGKVAMTSSIDILRDMGRNRGPKKTLVAFGYTGWGPGQLEGELVRHFWFTIPDDPKLIFDDDRAKVWDEAMARRGKDL